MLIVGVVASCSGGGNWWYEIKESELEGFEWWLSPEVVWVVACSGMRERMESDLEGLRVEREIRVRQ